MYCCRRYLREIPPREGLGRGCTVSSSSSSSSSNSSSWGSSSSVRSNNSSSIDNEASEREAPAFFCLFSQEKRSLFITGRTRVRRLVLNSPYVCVTAVCDSTFFGPRLSTALDAHGTNASPGGLCGRTRTNESFSCWCGCKSSLRVGRAMCGNVCRHMAGPWLKKQNLP